MKRVVQGGGMTQQSDADATPLDYAEFFSALRYYAGMNKQEILTSSRAYLTELYGRYVKRACENLGVPEDGDKDSRKKNAKGQLSMGAYPRDLKAERELAKKAAETPPTPLDKDFLSNFSQFNPNKYKIPTSTE